MIGPPMKIAPRSRSALAADVPPREVFAWAMYDFANSGYTTVVITAVFNAYFVRVVAGNAPWATFLWTATLAVSYAAVVLTAPAIGAWADLHAAKKRLLWITTAGCVAATAALGMAGPEALVLTCVLVAVSNFFFGTGENVAAAFLPELARGEAIGRVSGWGWSLGYLGGMLTLGLCLVYVTLAERAGYTAEHFVPVTMLITAGMFMLAALPTLLVLRERAVPQAGAGRGAVASAFARLADTARHARRYRDLARFLGCLVFYQAGVQAVVTLAAIYAQEAMGFDTAETIVLILAVNLTAALGAFAFGYVQDRLGHVPTVALTLAGWIVMIVLAWWATDRTTFWIAANLAGICLGSSQSAGRALVGYLSPPAHRAEFFGLWGLAVKLSSILGPVTYGLATWLSDGDHRRAMLITGLYFLIGLGILATVNTRRGRIAALRAERAERRTRGGTAATASAAS
jgi:UMF1 family MFS transporter